MSERDVLARYIRFRIWSALGCIAAVIVLIAPAFGTWFSDNPAAASGILKETGAIDHWNLWAVTFGWSGCGNCGLTSKVAGPPVGIIGDLERGLGLLVILALAFTVVCLLWTAAKGVWGTALAAAIGSAGVFALTMWLRFKGDADHQGNLGPHSYNTGEGMAVMQWAAVAGLLWACYVMTVAHRHWRRARYSELQAFEPVPPPTRPVP